MADSADNASADAEVHVKAAIEAARKQVTGQVRQPNGFCHWCDEAVEAGLAYCDEHCLEDHRKHQRAREMAKR